MARGLDRRTGAPSAPDRSAPERRLAALAHAAGVLGATGLGWALAAGVSTALVNEAGRRRSRYLAVHAGQAALYQLAVLAVDLGLVVAFVAGLLYFLELDLPGLPSISGIYVDQTLETVVSIVWVLLGVAAPVWHVATLYWAVRAARRAAAGEAARYPLVSSWVSERSGAAAARRPAPPAAAADEVGPEPPV